MSAISSRSLSLIRESSLTTKTREKWWVADSKSLLSAEDLPEELSASLESSDFVLGSSGSFGEGEGEMEGSEVLGSSGGF